jgi:hypothetical protein
LPSVESLRAAALKLSRLPPRSPLPFAALPSVWLLPAAPLTDNTDQENDQMTRLRLAVATLTHAPARRRSKMERVVLNALTEAMRPLPPDICLACGDPFRHRSEPNWHFQEKPIHP